VSTEPADTVAALTKVLVRAVRELADAGEPRRAGVLAADGWAAVRGDYPRAAAHLDGAMHYVARKDDAPVPIVSEQNT
jgi:hypothetical protein